MPRIRRTLTDFDILEMVQDTPTARMLRQQGRTRSTPHTAVFLWLVFALMAAALAGTFLWEALERPEGDGDHCADAGADIECAERDGGDKADRKGNHVGHGFIVPRPSRAGYVRGRLP